MRGIAKFYVFREKSQNFQFSAKYCEFPFSSRKIANLLKIVEFIEVSTTNTGYFTASIIAIQTKIRPDVIKSGQMLQK